MSEKYPFIEIEEGHHCVRAMCRWAGLSRAGYYECRDTTLTATALRRELLAVVVTDVFTDSDGTNGYRRVAAQAARRGYSLDRQTTRGIMAEQGLVAASTRELWQRLGGILQLFFEDRAGPPDRLSDITTRDERHRTMDRASIQLEKFALSTRLQHPNEVETELLTSGSVIHLSVSG